MTKSLGQINYEACTPEWVTALVPWEGVPVAEQRRWQAVAEAVVESQRTELERLVKEWRERAFVDFHSSAYTASERGKDCADDLEAVLRPPSFRLDLSRSR